MSRTLCLTRQQMATLGQVAMDAFPAECCGLLAGHPEGNAVTVTRIRPSANIADGNAHDRFEVDPKVRFDLMRELDGTDETIIGHFHSHPGGTASPSAHDVTMAFEPDLIWLILAVGEDGQMGDVAGYQLDREHNSIRSVDLKVLSD